MKIVNAFSVDVEDYYMVSAYADVVRLDEWERHESHVEANTRRVMDLLDEYGIKATFFTLGWVAERQPAMVRAMAAAGHEVASLSYRHPLLYRLDRRAEARDQFERALRVDPVRCGARATAALAKLAHEAPEPPYTFTDVSGADNAWAWWAATSVLTGRPS